MNSREGSIACRLQTSLEFVTVLAVVSVLALYAVVAYRGLAVDGKAAVQGIGPMSINAPNDSFTWNDTQRPAVSAYMPLNSAVSMGGIMQIGAFGCSNGSMSYSLSSGSMVFSPQNYSFSIDGLGMTYVRYVPVLQGLDSAALRYTIDCGPYKATETRNLTTYAAAPSAGTGNQSQYYAAIYSRNESLEYQTNSSEAIDSFSQFNHCTLVDWWGRTLAIGSQCHTTDAYEWSAFDGNCGSYSRTYCIVPFASGNYIAAGDNGRPAYSFVLGIGTPAGEMHAQFNGSGRAGLFLGTDEVGNASIESVYVQDQQQNVRIYNGSAARPANYTLYLMFEQAKAETLSTLSYYNHTGAGSEMEQAVYSYGQSAASLEDSSASGQGACRNNGAYLFCAAGLPFEYVINVTTSEPIGTHTMSYEGSIVHLTGVGA